MALIRARLFFLILFAFVGAEAQSCFKLLGIIAAHLTPNTYVTTISSGTPSVKDHVMGQGDKVLIPSPAYIDAVLSGALSHPEAQTNGVIVLDGATLPSKAFVLPEGKIFDLRTTIETIEAKQFKFSVDGAPSGTDRTRTYFKGTGRFEAQETVPEIGVFDGNRPIKDVDPKAYYGVLAKRGINFGPTYKSLTKVRVLSAKSNGELTPHPELEFDGHAISPPLLDSAIHSVGTILLVNEPGWPLPAKFVALPTAYRRIFYFPGRAGKADKFYCEASVEKVFSGEANQTQVEFNLALKNAKGEVVIVLEGGVLTVANLGARE